MYEYLQRPHSILSLTPLSFLQNKCRQHIFADTLRSVAVISFSLLAKYTSVITSEVADAAATVIVTVVVVISLFPLITGIAKTFVALRDVNRLLKIKKEWSRQRWEQGCCDSYCCQ